MNYINEMIPSYVKDLTYAKQYSKLSYIVLYEQGYGSQNGKKPTDGATNYETNDPCFIGTFHWFLKVIF